MKTTERWTYPIRVGVGKERPMWPLDTAHQLPLFNTAIPLTALCDTWFASPVPNESTDRHLCRRLPVRASGVHRSEAMASVPKAVRLSLMTLSMRFWQKNGFIEVVVFTSSCPLRTSNDDGLAVSLSSSLAVYPDVG